MAMVSIANKENLFRSRDFNLIFVSYQRTPNIPLERLR